MGKAKDFDVSVGSSFKDNFCVDSSIIGEKAQSIQKEAPATALKEKEAIEVQYALEEDRMNQKFENDSTLAGAKLSKTLYNHMVQTSISKARTYLVTHVDQVGQNASFSKVVDLIDSEKEVALA